MFVIENELYEECVRLLAIIAKLEKELEELRPEIIQKTRNETLLEMSRKSIKIFPRISNDGEEKDE